MKSSRKKILLKELSSEIKKSKITALSSRETAKDFRRASRSQQGDRRLYENAADLAESKHEELLEFQKELTQISETESKTVTPFSYVEIKYDDGQVGQLYFTPKRVQLQNLFLVSQESPLGKAIMNKKLKDKFSFEIPRGEQVTKVSGLILKIE
ncbi:GreA/GreB family elongation factor [Patescibacteria group bacterium]